MATLRPFRGLRPLRQYAAQVASPPYDVLTSDEAREEASNNPLSFLHVGKPEIDLPRSVPPTDERVYLKGGENLRQLISGGILKQDEQPCLYIYAQTMGSHTQYGIAACVPVEEYIDGTIRKHELTRPDKEEDRTRHIDATGAQTGPIFLAYRGHEAIDSVVKDLCKPAPEYDFVARDHVRHRLWVVASVEAIRNLAGLFEGVKNLYIADGHHRAAAAARVMHLRSSGADRRTGGEEYNFILAVVFPHTELRILGYNRVIRDLNGRTTSGFISALGRTFDVRRSSVPVMPAHQRQFGMYLDGSWYIISSSESSSAPDAVGQLDVSLLQHHLLEPVLGIGDARTDKRMDFVGGIRGLGELERRVNSGEMSVAFSLYPTTLEELFLVADAGGVMPPKSTWFEPKLRDGVLIHLLD